MSITCNSRESEAKFPKKGLRKTIAGAMLRHGMGNRIVSIYQDWWDHVGAVLMGAVKRYRAATRRQSSSLHNAVLLHDLGKLKEQIQKWFSWYCFYAHRYSFPSDKLVAHTLHRRGTKEHFNAEKRTNERVGKKPGHQLEGAAIALDRAWLDASMIVLGHHKGLPDVDHTQNARSIPSCFTKTVSRELVDGETFASAYNNALAEAKNLLAKAQYYYHGFRLQRAVSKTKNVDTEFDLRLQFSCLVDADWDDTERWIKEQDHDYFKMELPPLRKLFRRLKFIETYRQQQKKLYPNEIICEIRDRVYQHCFDAAHLPPGVFTLNAPAGSAKTIGSLVFALRHAEKHNLRRIIYVVPYLTVIEQNATEIRQALGIDKDCSELFVFEHHSIADPLDLHEDGRIMSPSHASAVRSRITNWDAPVIITTNVQFFDSLFSNYPSRCRKLHNIARSVVILDECQNVHPHLLQPTCQMIKQFVQRAGCTFLLCTATQPQWHVRQRGLADYLPATAIVPRPSKLFEKAKRVEASWPVNDENTWTIPDLAAHMISNSTQSAAIVDTRKKAQQLFMALSAEYGNERVFHLSTSMCPMHRKHELNVLLDRLSRGASCFLAATPILEAGVNISFPVIYREFGPLDLIVQAAGRGNRHAEQLLAKVIVFLLLDADGKQITGDEKHCPPDKWYRFGTEVLLEILRAEGPPDINRPDILRSYYKKLYSKGTMDENGISAMRERWACYSVANAYKTLEDQSRPVVCSTWDQTFGEIADERILKWFEHARIGAPEDNEVMSAVIRRINDALRKRPRNSWLLNLLSYFSANIFWRNFQELQDKNLITRDEETGVDFWNGPYHPRVGLIY